MAEALALAGRGRGLVEPNPMVGAVLVRGGRVVGAGWHRRYGGPHAEIEALRRAGTKARGADLYVTLEPCAHHGKTPPCAAAVVRAGIRRVAAAMRDPHPLVSGRGLAALSRAGIRVETGLLEGEARRLNAAFLSLVLRGRPLVTAKWAMSLDGKIATASGDSKWITSPEARREARRMRGFADAVLVGAGTVAADDPRLMPEDPRRMPVRVVADSRGRTGLASRLVRSARQSPVMVVVTDRAPVRARRALRAAGCEVWEAPSSDGRVDLRALLRELGRRRMSNLFVEGGGRLLGALFDARLVDRAAVFVAPRVLGGAEALTPVEGVGVRRVSRSAVFAWGAPRRVGTDWLLTGEAAPSA